MVLKAPTDGATPFVITPWKHGFQMVRAHTNKADVRHPDPTAANSTIH